MEACDAVSSELFAVAAPSHFRIEAQMLPFISTCIESFSRFFIQENPQNAGCIA